MFAKIHPKKGILKVHKNLPKLQWKLVFYVHEKSTTLYRDYFYGCKWKFLQFFLLKECISWSIGVWLTSSLEYNQGLKEERSRPPFFSLCGSVRFTPAPKILSVLKLKKILIWTLPYAMGPNPIWSRNCKELF